MRTFMLTWVAVLSTTLTFAQTNRIKGEIFIEIADRGSFTVYLDNEFAGSAQGRFRFYNVFNSVPVLSVLQGNKVIFKRTLQAKDGERIILRYAARDGLTVIKELDIFRNRQYALNDWDNYAGAYNTGIVPPGRYTAGVMSEQAFDNLLQLVKKEAFDDGRLKLIYAASRNSGLATSQLKPLIAEVSFEENKLKLAKDAYLKCPDKENYFTLVDVFKFKSTMDALLDFIGKN